MKERYTRHPLVREGGALRRASWDEALHRAASGFRAAVRDHEPGSFGLFSCSKATNEMNFLAVVPSGSRSRGRGDAKRPG